MKKIILINKTLLMGGIEKSIELFAKDLNKQYEIEVIYLTKENLDNKIKKRIEKFAKVSYINDYNSKIFCDVCIWCTLYFEYNKIKPKIIATKYFAWIHSMPRAFENCLLDNNEFIENTDEFICVSEAVKNNLNLKKEGKVIHNFINPKIKSLAKLKNNVFKKSESQLKLTTVSRISRGKGFERIREMSNVLNKMDVKYEWLIVGNGRTMENKIKSWFKGNDSIIFVGKKENPFPYIQQADYLIQLSDEETWGMVITEAKQLHVPCVITNFESSIEQIENGKNGIILELEGANYTQIISQMIKNKVVYKENLQNFKFINEKDEWIRIIENNKLQN